MRKKSKVRKTPERVVLIFDLPPNVSRMAAIKNGPGVPSMPLKMPPRKISGGFNSLGITKCGDQIVQTE